MLVGFQFVGVAVPLNGTALVALTTPRFDSLEPKEAFRGFTFSMTGSRVVVRAAATQTRITVNTALADERHIEQTSTNSGWIRLAHAALPRYRLSLKIRTLTVRN